MTSKEPIEEFHSFWQQLWAGFRSLFRNNSHRDLKRSYGKECALVLLKDVAHPDLYMRLDNGVVLKSLCDLADVLPELDEATFRRHTQKNQNDFTHWVKNTVGDRTLANKLELLDSKDDFARAVKVRVDWFKSRIG